MPATTDPATRAPVRQRLADAQDRHRKAVAQHERVATAQQRVMEERMSLRSRLDQAKADAELAHASAPRHLVDALLANEPSTGPSAVDAAREEVARLERRLRELEDAGELLGAEQRQADALVGSSSHALESAVRAVVGTDEATDRLIAAYKASARRTLQLAMALRSAGIDTGNVDAHGQRLNVTYIPVPMHQASAFTPDIEWQKAIAALRDSPDAELPGLPPPEPEPADVDVGDGNAAEAA